MRFCSSACSALICASCHMRLKSLIQARSECSSRAISTRSPWSVSSSEIRVSGANCRRSRSVRQVDLTQCHSTVTFPDREVRSMRFVECVDYGDAPTTFITGVASISLVSLGVVEIAFYRAVEQSDGTVERRVVEHQIWDRAVWLAEVARFREGRLAIEQSPALHLE